MLLTPSSFLVLIIVIFTIICYFFRRTFCRQRRAGEPPLVPGNWLLGNAPGFSEDAVKFLHQSRASQGDVFTIRLVNQHLTIIMDPHSYEPFCKNRQLDFDPIQKQVNKNVFNFVLKDPKLMIKNTGKVVSGLNLANGLVSFANNLNRSCDELSRGDVWTTGGNPAQPSKGTTRDGCDDPVEIQGGLRVMVARTIFDAIFHSIFGRSAEDGNRLGFCSESIFWSFEVFHKYFNYFWLGIPKQFFPEAMGALRSLLQMPNTLELLKRKNLSVYIETAIDCMLRTNQTESDVKGHNLVYLHVNYNTFRLGFWALSHLLQDRKAMDSLGEEIDEVRKRCFDADSNKASISLSDLGQMKILDSVVQEVCRLSSGVFMVRYVAEDTWFTTSKGESFLLRKGDRAAIYPPTIHKDPEIFINPNNFQFDRFIDAKFYKDGKEVKNPVLAFGSLCPGKNFALLQLKWYIVTMINRFDMSLGDQTPEYDYRYHGHEVLPPVNDVTACFTPRKNCIPMELVDV